jgi:Glycosyl hydrolase family 76
VTADFAALQRSFGRPGPAYVETFPSAGGATVWPVSQALAATIAVASLPGTGSQYRPALRSALRALQPYWDGRSPGAYASSARSPAAPRFFDDNDWLGLDLVAAGRLLGDRTLVAQAERIFGFVVSGWDGSASRACPGGVFWTTIPENRDRNTVSTANGALLGLELYLTTGKASYLGWARRMYDWVDRCLRQADGLYADRIMTDGRVEPTRWTYNQGAMIAAGVLLYQATGDVARLHRAEQTAAAALTYFSSRWDSEPPEFVAILFRDLAGLETLRPQLDLAGVIGGYLGSRARTRGSDGLYRADPQAPARLLEQAALVQIEAQLAGR